MILLLVLKIYLPKTFYLLRGNHECREVTQIYNFKRECTFISNQGLSKYGEQETYDLFVDLFWTLPLAAVVNGTYFCVHGGLSENLKFISDIEKIHRFREIPRKGLMCDMLWSDPVDDK
jgi:serine/threonine-protein phosphatase 2B catalytic subunit